MAALSACATPSDIKQVETKVDVLATKETQSKSEMSSTLKKVESKVDVLASKTSESKSELSSSLSDVLRKQENLEAWQRSAEDRFQVFMRNQADLKADLDSIDRKINGLGGGGEEIQHTLKKLDGRLVKLDERLRELYLAFVDAGMNQQLKAEALRRDMAALLEPVKAEMAEVRALVAAQQKKKGAAQTVPPAKKAEPVKKEEAKKEAPAAPAATRVASGKSADTLYGGGYTDYLKGDFAAAEAQFAEYVKRFPNTDLTGNAQFWSAESLANQGKAKEALAAFSETVKTFPRGAKAATALWRAAEISEKEGDRDKAREFLRKIVDNYPTSYEAAMVEDKLKTLDASGN